MKITSNADDARHFYQAMILVHIADVSLCDSQTNFSLTKIPSLLKAYVVKLSMQSGPGVPQKYSNMESMILKGLGQWKYQVINLLLVMASLRWKHVFECFFYRCFKY